MPKLWWQKISLMKNFQLPATSYPQVTKGFNLMGVMNNLGMMQVMVGCRWACHIKSWLHNFTFEMKFCYILLGPTLKLLWLKIHDFDLMEALNNLRVIQGFWLDMHWQWESIQFFQVLNEIMAAKKHGRPKFSICQYLEIGKGKRVMQGFWLDIDRPVTLNLGCMLLHWRWNPVPFFQVLHQNHGCKKAGPTKISICQQQVIHKGPMTSILWRHWTTWKWCEGLGWALISLPHSTLVEWFCIGVGNQSILPGLASKLWQQKSRPTNNF